MRAPARVYTCTHPCAVCFGSWVEGESSITGFIFLCLTPFLPSSGCFCSECLQRAHHSLAIRNNVFITVTTKDIACPPTLPPAVLLYPGAALLVPSRRLCPLFGEEPLAHMPSAPVLHPEHPSRSLAKRSAATCPEIPGLAPSPLTQAFSWNRCLKISLLFLLSSKACQSHWKGAAGRCRAPAHVATATAFSHGKPSASPGGREWGISGTEGCGAKRHRDLGPVRKEKALSHWVTRQQLLFQ